MMSSAEANMPIFSHLKELRRCLIISAVALGLGFFLALPFYERIIEFLSVPLQGLTASENGEILYITTLAEGFLVRLKISALAGLIISSPIHLFNTLSFVLPGLVKKEKQILLITLLCSLLLVLGSFFYSYSTIIPVSVVFLTGQGFIPHNTGMLLNFSGNIFYILQFILLTLLVFQLPIVLEILLMMNILKRKALFKFGRYVIVLFFLVAALLTPPDFITQIGLALPMTVLYYLTLIIAKIFRFGEDKCSDWEPRKSSSLS
ncbi:MAG: twin-arginine translocase subunit TatC [Spirochaetales bacterium]|nr:twin-arginine translocase subunit TatC [Spirochaetales bacterium]